MQLLTIDKRPGQSDEFILHVYRAGKMRPTLIGKLSNGTEALIKRVFMAIRRPDFAHFFVSTVRDTRGWQFDVTATQARKILRML
ncbi:hypothetical protein [Terriglobus roseus]|uniref:Uncharacterized protein n=1 Tax=Terriglobus roseus TaxID=392734 RepID=A0A1H4K1U6_9BACT|nr:hypothetical protein [Terriglobus roseus]SEB52095.1 hypothetical protein SAMN05443244_0937 [Terriglobus roseus]